MSEPAAETSAARSIAAGSAAASATRRSRLRARSVAGMLLQVVLIALGVFLGLAGEEWREDRENRSLAAETLRRFRVELMEAGFVEAYDVLIPAIDAELAK
jgi:hypothetical protein